MDYTHYRSGSVSYTLSFHSGTEQRFYMYLPEVVAEVRKAISPGGTRMMTTCNGPAAVHVLLPSYWARNQEQD